MEHEKHFNISSGRKGTIDLGTAKVEMIGSATGLEDASHVLYRPSSLEKVEMRRKGYGVNTDLIYV